MEKVTKQGCSLILGSLRTHGSSIDAYYQIEPYIDPDLAESIYDFIDWVTLNKKPFGRGSFGKTLQEYIGL